MHRRTLMKTASAAALAGLMKGARDARADGHGSGDSRPSYTAAVARLVGNLAAAAISPVDPDLNALCGPVIGGGEDCDPAPRP